MNLYYEENIMGKIHDATESNWDFVKEQLEQHVKSLSPSFSNEPTAYFYRCIKENGEVVAGVLAESYCNAAVFVDILWVREDFRGRGYATALLNDVEKLAYESGRRVSCLSTYTFQARGLYEKLGYNVFGTITDCPQKGCNDFYLSKILTANNYSANIEIHDAENPDTDVIVGGIVAYNKSKIPFTQSPNNIRFGKCINVGDEIVAGIASLSSCWKLFYILGVWVDEACRNKGYATALIKAAEKEARDFGCEVAILETFNPAMRKLCEKLGYIVYGELENYPQGHTRYYMTKKLEEI
jgi:ribosomal protein S18 acetylase RimI-like enzyme